MTIDFTRSGRMIAGSKIAPTGHVCVWNANLCIKSKGKVWFGDLDLTADAAELKRFAAECGERLYVLREHDARFDTEASPQYQRAVAHYDPDGSNEYLGDPRLR